MEKVKVAGERGKEEEDLAISGNSPFREETINISCLATHTHTHTHTHTFLFVYRTRRTERREKSKFNFI